MSRRRLPVQPPSDPRWVSVAVVCTGRSRHARHAWGRIDVHPDPAVPPALGSLTPSGSYIADPAASKMDRGEVPSVEDMIGVHKTFVFHCPRCAGRGAEYRLTQASLERLARVIAEADTPRRLDLSALHALSARITK